jgi:SPP1 gp7 family putative phage head morphogenesis protein
MKGPRSLRALQPNAGLQAAYRRKLLKMIDEMIASYERWVIAAYRKNPPSTMAMDRGFDDLRKAIEKLGKRWTKEFEKMAWNLGEWFAISIDKRNHNALRKILKEGGWTVQYQRTRKMNEVMTAIVSENVSLIKTIPQQFHGKIEPMVMNSVAAGRNIGALRKELQSTFKVTRKRADLIARDQNNKATNQLARVRYMGMDLKEAIWMHSHAGKTPRPTHLANHGKKFDLLTGWFDPHERKWILPGYLINCRCTMRPVVKGFT